MKPMMVIISSIVCCLICRAAWARVDAYYSWGRWFRIKHYERSDKPNPYESFRMAQEAVRGVNILEQTPGEKKEPDTELGRLAASMKAGEWKELKTAGYAYELLSAYYPDGRDNPGRPGGSIFNYTNTAAWDPISRSLYFVGLGHYRALKFIRYSADTNSWTLMPVPPWAEPARRADGHWPVGHAYCKNTLDVARRWLLFEHGTTTIYRYDITRDTWEVLTETEKGMPTFKDANIAIRVFPEMDGVVRFWKGTAHLFRPTENSWQQLCREEGVAMHCFAEYSPRQKVILFGGGDASESPTRIYRLDATAKGTGLKPAPIPHITSHQGSVVTVDPVTGVFLIASRGTPKSPLKKFYAFDALKDQWQELPYGLPEATWMVAAPVTNYGVTIFCAHKPERVWLYKHASGEEDRLSGAED